MAIDTTIIPQTTKVDGVTIENTGGIINVKNAGIGLNQLDAVVKTYLFPVVTKPNNLAGEAYINNTYTLIQTHNIDVSDVSTIQSIQVTGTQYDRWSGSNSNYDFRIDGVSQLILNSLGTDSTDVSNARDYTHIINLDVSSLSSVVLTIYMRTNGTNGARRNGYSAGSIIKLNCLL